MILRPGENSDIDNATEVVDQFVKEAFAESGISMQKEFALEQFKKYAEHSLVAYEDDKLVGLIAGEVVTLDVSSDLAFQEKVWYVLPKYRIGVGPKLLRAMEDRLKVLGVKYCLMAHIGEQKSLAIERFYRSNGYRAIETHYMKTLK